MPRKRARRNRPALDEPLTTSSVAPLPSRLWLAIALLCVSTTAGGCAFDSHVPVQFSGRAPLGVQESSRPEQTSHRVRGTTTRPRQRVGIECSNFVDYEPRDPLGTGFLLQQYVVHLHTRPLPAGTAYTLSCSGTLIVELPVGASHVRATATGTTGRQVILTLRTQLRSLPLSFGRRLRAERGTQLVAIRWPDSLPAGHYRTQLSFSLSGARSFREKAVYAASITCGGATYLQPILPIVTAMKQAPSFTIQPSTHTVRVLLPPIAPGDVTEIHARRTISCRR
jgi:hypothetical protein